MPVQNEPNGFGSRRQVPHCVVHEIVEQLEPLLDPVGSCFLAFGLAVFPVVWAVPIFLFAEVIVPVIHWSLVLETTGDLSTLMTTSEIT